MNDGMRQCLIGALLSTLGSLAGKYAFNVDDRKVVLDIIVRFIGDEYSTVIDRVVMLVLAVLMLAINSWMLTYLVKAMHSLGTVTATTVISNVGFGLSGVFGALCFGEVLGTKWLTGMICIATGVVLMTIEPKNKSKIE